MSRGPRELEADIVTALAPIEAVRVAYLFGSRARGDARKDSDLDIAVAFASDADTRSREQTRRVVVAALTDALGALGECADIVDLEEADSAVSFRAVQAGRLLLTRSLADRVRIETRVARRYDDDAPKRALFRRAARDSVARFPVK